MATSSISRGAPTSNPLDVVERLISAYDWTFDRLGEREMAAQAPGNWCELSLFFAWNEDADAVHFTCAFDLRIGRDKRPSVHELLALVNERLWLGHFCIWDEEGLPMFRHALPLRGTGGLCREQIEDLVDVAIVECERFYPAFQYVVWGGRTPADALAAAMIETVGEA